MKFDIKPYISGIIKAGVAIALIWWLSTSGKFDWDMLSGVLSSWYCVLLMILVFTNLVLNSLRWHWVLQALGIKQSFYSSFRLNMIGIFFNYFMPGGVGGDIIKGYYIVRNNPDKRTYSAASILQDRLIGFTSMALMALAAIFVNMDLLLKDWRLQSIALSLGGIVSGFLVLLLISSSKKSIHFIENWKVFQLVNVKGIPMKIINSFHYLSKNKLTIGVSFGLSLLSQTALIMVVYFTSTLVLEVPLSLSTVYFAVPLGMMVSAAPIAPAGIGVGQVAMFSFFQMLNAPDPNIGTTGITVIQLMLFAWGILGSYYYIRMNAKVKWEPKGA